MQDWFKTSLPAILVTLTLAFGSYVVLIEQRLSNLEANYKHLETLTQVVNDLTKLNYKMDKRISIMETTLLGANEEL
ncbi:hypothetical protein H0A36_28850 [Endozoicomonas sp. SM1973]|uniref:Uncharacterized protein n=1 Tax=Spartinivicinus marinus TaxID=2994442 RepID=A0A853IHP4_9GAMM|nr:hypothetical protein [Spartinivicinus marinus]MCX4024739.1 hypothetical protein [Spartinivicinus marinus]MCX4025622.1 hypothetical protein [Spartinivicinus marinus]NYZ70028.1 hypothetical protein [Spartinivicinus marinus]